MKIKFVKILFGIAIGALIGYICKMIANDAHQWYSFAVASISIIGALILALSSYSKVDGPRETNVKLVAWIMALVMIATNVAFAFTNYKTDVYIVILALLFVIDSFIVYRMVAK